MKILIVDDQRLMREGLTTINGLEPAMEVVGTLLKELKKMSDMSPGQAHPLSKNELDELGLLTEREKDVLALLGQGLNNKEIAGLLYLMEGTVKNHVSNLIAKLGLRDRTQAAVFSVRQKFNEESR